MCLAGESLGLPAAWKRQPERPHETMTVRLFDAIDDAQLVITDGDLFAFAVWHGGHTINFYQINPNTHDVKPTTAISIGDYETGEPAREDAREAITGEFNKDRERLGLTE